MQAPRYVVLAAAGAIALGAQSMSTVQAASPGSPATVPTPNAAAQHLNDGHLQLTQPRSASWALTVARNATPQNPIELLFQSGEWSGGVVLNDASDASQNLLSNFIRTSAAAKSSTPVIGINGSVQTLNLPFFASMAGVRTARPNNVAAAPSSQLSSGVAASGTDRWVNNASQDPSVPTSGQLRQFRQQGLIEATTHTIRGFSKSGYPALVHTVDMTQGHGGTIKPKYIYEHDYKIKKNGYVGTDPSYSWTSNLPGAYRDTRARGLEGGDTELDFTVGSVFTWLLDSSKTYTTTTQASVNGATAATSSTARLTASVIPNDGGFSEAEAAVGNGCAFVVDPSNPALTPTRGNGDLAWCGGIGDLVHPSSVKNIALIQLPNFAISYTGTCYNWVTNHGSTRC